MFALFGGYSTIPLLFLKPTSYNTRLNILTLQGITIFGTTLVDFLSSCDNLTSVSLSFILLDENVCEWSEVFEVLKRRTLLFFFEGLHYQLGDPTYFWGDEAVGGYRWRRPLESHLEDDYVAFRMFRDGVLQRRSEKGLPDNLFMNEFCMLDICFKLIWEMDDDDPFE